MEQMKSGFSHDKHGSKSSKRLAGFILIGCGTSVLTLLGVLASFYGAEIKNAEMAYKAGFALCGIGAALLGVSLVEWFAPKKPE